MAIISITEYINLATDAAGRVIPAGAEPAVASFTLDVAAQDEVSDPFSSATRYIRVCADVACHVAIGRDPEATLTDTYLPANTIEYFGVFPGMEISVIAAEA